MLIGLDFDGTLAEGRPLVWRAGAAGMIQQLVRAGHQVVLHSARLRPQPDERPQPDARQQADCWYGTGQPPQEAEELWDGLDEMRAFLQQAGCWDLVILWQGRGKPDCDILVDDRAEQPDWLALQRELGLPWAV